MVLAARPRAQQATANGIACRDRGQNGVRRSCLLEATPGRSVGLVDA
jgi:hypothetical protein